VTQALPDRDPHPSVVAAAIGVVKVPTGPDTSVTNILSSPSGQMWNFPSTAAFPLLKTKVSFCVDKYKSVYSDMGRDSTI
jgi:hypothetical protein